MARPGPPATPTHSSPRPLPEKFLASVVFAGVAFLPLLFAVPGYDSFRLPKEIAYRGEAILSTASVIAAIVIGGPRVLRAFRMPRAVTLLVAVTVAWVVFTAAFSTNRTLSASALGYSATGLLVFAATYFVLKDRPVEWLLVPVAIAAVPNAVIAMLQAARIWNPFRVDTDLLSPREQITAFLGNPNDVGMYLMLAALCMATAAVVTGRWWWWCIAGVSAAGMIASGTLTAIISLTAGLCVLSMLISRRMAWITIATVVIAAAMLPVVIPPLRQRIATMHNAFRRGDYPAVTSYRLYSVGPAFLMFRERPFTGVGPGAFKFNYLPFRQQFDLKYPQWYLAAGATQNFAEVHCDHLQILAEEGLPGYALFVSALVMLASVTFRRQSKRISSSPRRDFARLLSLPFAVSLFISALAAFPLELVAPTQLLLHMTAAVVRWGRDE